MSKFWTYQGKIVREISHDWPNAIVEYWTGEQVAVHGRDLSGPISRFEDYNIIDTWPTTSQVPSQEHQT